MGEIRVWKGGISRMWQHEEWKQARLGASAAGLGAGLGTGVDVTEGEI